MAIMENKHALSDLTRGTHYSFGVSITDMLIGISLAGDILNRCLNMGETGWEVDNF